MFNQRGQSIIEYAVFLTVFIAAIIVMSVYIKRGIQGNWHSNTAESFPEYYDPATTKEKSPLQIQISNYTLGISEEGSTDYTPKPITWVKDGNTWQIWSR